MLNLILFCNCRQSLAVLSAFVGFACAGLVAFDSNQQHIAMTSNHRCPPGLMIS
jgi:hypothetical protein